MMIEHEFAYEISAECKLFGGTYTSVKLNFDKALTNEVYAEFHKSLLVSVASSLGTKPEYLTPISLSQFNEEES